MPLSPTATKRDPDQTTLIRADTVPMIRAVQVFPSGEVISVPLNPTATNCDPDQVTASSWRGEIEGKARE
ncbi:hypothetical protein KSB_85520 [Ktedonobacter robiniae]|uniref:Uncharacterized protein n=1 Tax=Ktedonobacter robiniae TaxID=2778365 RepID=A0ABQ3V5P1_9CHLR|nr:hypothetical protein KSB_85520 [Ktedonobacter robiniae]